MFRFLFGGRGPEAATGVVETDRDAFVRALGEVNDLIARLPRKPKVTIDPETGQIALEMPEQFPDEAKALPPPQPAASPKTSGPKPAAPPAPSGLLPRSPGSRAATAPKAAAPEPRVPEPRSPQPRR